MSVVSEDFGFFVDIDFVKVGGWYGVVSGVIKKVSEIIGSMVINWSVVVVLNLKWV